MIPEPLIPAVVGRVAGGRVQVGRGADGLRDHPVEPVSHADRAVRTERVREARALIVPGIGDRAAEQIHCRAGHPGALHARPFVHLDQQPGPLQRVPGNGPVRPEQVTRPVGVEVGHRPPGGVVVLRHAPAVGGGELADDPLGDARRTAGVALVAGGVGRCEEGFGQMHVRVLAAVVAAHGPAAVPLLDVQAVRAVQHPGRDDVAGLLDQVMGVVARLRRGARRQQHERVAVCLLARIRRAVRAGRPHRRVPAAVPGVAEPLAQATQPVLDEKPAARAAEQTAQGEAVHEARVDPQFLWPVGYRPAGLVEPEESAAVPVGRALVKREQALRLSREPGPVARAVTPGQADLPCSAG